MLKYLVYNYCIIIYYDYAVGGEGKSGVRGVTWRWTCNSREIT